MGLPAIKPEPEVSADLLIARLRTDLTLISLQIDNTMVMLDGERKKHNRNIRDSKSSAPNEVDE